jgi:CRP-like cAMP-binding protein
METQADLTSARTTGKALQADTEDSGRKSRILELSPFAGLGPESRSALLDIGTVEKLTRRYRIAQQGEPANNLLLIGSGRVKLERVSGDRVFPVGHRGPGETVGETALGNASVCSESATVLDDTEALVLPLPAFRKLLTADEALRNAVLVALSDRHLATERRLESLLLHGVEARLVDFLLASLVRWSEAHPNGELITAPFTHADIALLVGSTRETVTLLLGKLKRGGLIDFEKRRIIVRDREALLRHVVT